jgi:hypothetical protein
MGITTLNHRTKAMGIDRLIGLMRAIDPEKKLPLALRKHAAEAYWDDILATRAEPEGFVGGLMLKGFRSWGWDRYFVPTEAH